MGTQTIPGPTSWVLREQGRGDQGRAASRPRADRATSEVGWSSGGALPRENAGTATNQARINLRRSRARGCHRYHTRATHQLMPLGTTRVPFDPVNSIIADGPGRRWNTRTPCSAKSRVAHPGCQRTRLELPILLRAVGQAGWRADTDDAASQLSTPRAGDKGPRACHASVVSRDGARSHGGPWSECSRARAVRDVRRAGAAGKASKAADPRCAQSTLLLSSYCRTRPRSIYSLTAGRLRKTLSDLSPGNYPFSRFQHIA